VTGDTICAIQQQLLTECSVGCVVRHGWNEAVVLQGCQATQEHHPAKSSSSSSSRPISVLHKTYSAFVSTGAAIHAQHCCNALQMHGWQQHCAAGSWLAAIRLGPDKTCCRHMYVTDIAIAQTTRPLSMLQLCEQCRHTGSKDMHWPPSKSAAAAATAGGAYDHAAS
jgi:hypothetical protein